MQRDAGQGCLDPSFRRLVDMRILKRIDEEAKISEVGKVEELPDQGSIEDLFLQTRLCKDKVARMILFSDLVNS